MSLIFRGRLLRMINVTLLCGLILLLLGKVAYSEDKPTVVYRFGAILPLTGITAFLGQQELVGLELAIEDINSKWVKEKKLYRIELFVQDSASKPANAATIARKMIDVDKVHALFVSTSAANQAVAPIASEARIPLFVMASEPGLTKEFDNMFRVFMNFDGEAKVLAGYIAAKQYKRIGIIHANLRAFNGELEALRKYLSANITVPVIENYELGNRDFRQQIEKIAKSNIDAILILGQGPELSVLVSNIRVHPSFKTIPLIGGFTFLSEAAKSSGTDIYEGIAFSSFPFSSDSPELRSFQKRKTSEGKTLSDFVDYAYAYDNAVFFATAIENMKPGEPLLTSLTRIKEIYGITGNIKIDENRDSIVIMRMATYKSGKVIYLK